MMNLSPNPLSTHVTTNKKDYQQVKKEVEEQSFSKNLSSYRNDSQGIQSTDNLHRNIGNNKINLQEISPSLISKQD